MDLLQSYPLTLPVRLVGVGAGGLQPADTAVQADLFPEADEKLEVKWEKVDRAMDAVAERFGKAALKRGKQDW